MVEIMVRTGIVTGIVFAAKPPFNAAQAVKIIAQRLFQFEPEAGTVILNRTVGLIFSNRTLFDISFFIGGIGQFNTGGTDEFHFRTGVLAVDQCYC